MILELKIKKRKFKSIDFEKEKKVYSTRYSQVVSLLSTNQARRCLTSVIEREPVLSA